METELFGVRKGYTMNLVDMHRSLSTATPPFPVCRGFQESFDAMRTMWKALLWIGGSVIVLAFCLIATAFLRTRAEARRADQLRTLVIDFAIGRTQESEVMRDARPFLSGITAQARDDNGGDYRSFIFDNMQLHRLHLSQYRRFTIRLRFRDGVLLEKNAEFSVEHDCRVEVTERAREVPGAIPSSDLTNHYSTVPSGFSKPVDIATIIDDVTYPERLRSQDWRFDLSYLARFGGCTDARSILPAISR